jgi:hypothetical protein
MRTKPIILAGAGIAILVATIVALWPLGKPLFLETPTGRYRVISARYASGTNLTFATGSPILEWLRRQLDMLGIHLKGSRGVMPFAAGVKVQAISVLCKGPIHDNNLTGMDPAFVDGAGRRIPLNHRMQKPISGDRVYFMFFYTDADNERLHRLGFADSDVTNFCPRQLVLFRKSDGHELTRLNLSR